MAHAHHDDIRRPPPLWPAWTTWVYMAFALAVAVGTVVGFWYWSELH